MVGKFSRLLRYLWALPTTMVGLFVTVLALLTGGRAKVHTGVLEVHGGFATWLLRTVRAGAMTLGHVVIALDEAAHDFSREHERVHVRQVEVFGPFFLPAYGLASLWAYLRGAHYYYSNPFEIEAYGLDLSARRDARR